MIRWEPLWTLARAEMRITRRLVRYWVFAFLALLAGGAGFTYYSVIHRFLSSYSATIGSIHPRYLIAAYGQFMVLIFLVGLVFLAFDLRARDERDRIVEVLDAKPVSNLELVLGRLLGLVIMSWIPALVTVGVVYIIGALLGSLPEPFSVLVFLTSMTVPAFVFGAGFVFFLSIVLRYRYLAALVSLALLFLAVFGSQRLPIYWTPIGNVAGAWVLGYPSDLLPLMVDWMALGQRLAMLCLGLGLAVLAAVLHPRKDDAPTGALAGGGAALLVVGVLLTANAVLDGRRTLDRLEAQRRAHEAAMDEPRADLLALSGRVELDPGRQLRMHLETRCLLPETVDGPLVFTLNPGLTVTALADGAGTALQVRQQDGLVRVRWPGPAPAGSETTLRWTIQGEPDPWFGYLDASFHPLGIKAQDAAVFLLGFMPGLFTRSYAALMPGTDWLPVAGPDVARSDPRRRARDYFDLDLEVVFPASLTVAGPGRLDPEESEGRRSVRLRPGAPVHEVALFAGEFETWSAEIEGVQFNLMLHPKHAGVVEVFKDAEPELRRRLGALLQDAAAAGLEYPYTGYTLVETPNMLRSYGGGWRMDTVLSPPGLGVVRETSFPTARFDLVFQDASAYQEREGGLPAAKVDRLQTFFMNDFTGGNVLAGGLRNLFPYLTSPTGPDAAALDFVAEYLLDWMFLDDPAYFSAHVFSQERFNALIQGVVSNLQRLGRSPEDEVRAGGAVIRTVLQSPKTWEVLTEKPVVDLKPEEDPGRALDVLVAKGSALARTLADGLGREATAGLLAGVRRGHLAGAFTRADLVAAGGDLDADLEGILRVWLDEARLPGIVVESAEAYRIPDDDGQPRYQVRVVLRNDEPAAGYVQLRLRLEGRSAPEISDPIRLDGRTELEFGRVFDLPPSSLTVDPYLSLNRSPFDVPLNVDTETIVEREPFDGVRVVAWSQPRLERLTRDDLDDGFRTESPERRKGLRVGGRDGEEQLDGGLPIYRFGRVPEGWVRWQVDSAWGRYRHTAALVRSGGEGEYRAVFEMTVPEAGVYEVQYHVPPAFLRRDRWKEGTWTLVLDANAEPETLTLDLASLVEGGWQVLREIRLEPGTLTVTISDATEAPVVVADAVRLKPLAVPGAEAGP